ncbi:hypothetical protein KAFR_0G02490 [Kazachstania africana CBS 2517]|uniref:Uncharacterized protein n=1 Tax=Kazachstania africana (strain ATCC 22294 / BCRC 22015 / CBS 2517 / CECT 1963 / NBRC 1671 / NRRL Y-8276) TaxID=1071382 RepID=H2AY32_KAZAF|nr:hypothetical protein KAFR_0G02490 [Kazachstania africana CBS 2517]CCF59282.1 hypothetical protein KAFR_0G02490 [Kazachstania africana CBS 2517]
MYNPVDLALSNFSGKYGIDDFTLRFATCLLGSFPLTYILKRIPNKNLNLKCTYIISISVFYLVGILNIPSGLRTLLISSMFTYVVTRFYHSRFMPYVNFVFVMGHLAINHIRATGSISNSIDITSAQMVLAMKLTSFAWSYGDGTYLKKDEFEKSLNKYQQARSIKIHPSLLEYLAFVFFFPTILTGPSFDFSDFDFWLNGKIFQDLPKDIVTTSTTNAPKNGRMVLFRVIQGIAWIVLHGYLSKFVSFGDYLNHRQNFSFIYKIHYMVILGMIARFKYYAAWIISESACILCGLGYNGSDVKTGKIKWDRVRNIDIWAVEFAESTRDCLEAWNMNTNRWLKYYVYFRVAKKGKKPGFRSTLFTFLTSAFWHGFSAGYYLTFATGALYQTCGKFYRRNFRPIFLSSDGSTAGKFKWIYDVMCWYVIKLSFGYLVMPFLALNFKDSILIWKSVYFYGHIIIVVSFFAFRGPFSTKFIKFFKSLQPSEGALQKQRAIELEISESASTLGNILKEKMEYDKALEVEENKIKEKEMHLGIPSIDPDVVEWDDAKEEWHEFWNEYTEWRNKNGLEVEEENLVLAFNNFKKEMADAAKDSSSAVRRISFSSYSPKPIKDKNE